MNDHLTDTNVGNIEYISKQDVLNLPQNIERNLRGEIVERSIDVKAIESLPSADVAPVETLKAEIYKLKHQSEQGFGNHDYYVGYISALSTVEGILAWMDEKE